MKKIVLLLGSTLFTLTLSTSVCAAQQTLIQKHGATWPKNTTGFAIKTECMKCHGDYKKLAAQTKQYTPNPHYSHMGEVNCVECHNPNSNKVEPMCNTCHKFKFEKKSQ